MNEKPDSRPAILIADADGRPGPAWQAAMSEKEDDISDLAARKLDVIYGRKDGMALVMDIYSPISNANQRAIICLISGGYWSGPEYRRMPFCTSTIRQFVAGGFTVFAAMHGSQPRYTIADMSRDTQRIIRYVRHHSAEYSIDPNAIGVFGQSSGGHLAILAATTGNAGTSNSPDPVERESSAANAVVAYFPPTDLVNYGSEDRLITTHFPAIGIANAGAFDFRRFDADRGMFVSIDDDQVTNTLRELSPIYHASADNPPTLLLHGDQDENVPLEQSQRFVERLNDLGAHAELFIASGKGHGPLEGTEEHVQMFFRRHLGLDGERNDE